jgi:hypothetical protein
LVLAAEDEALLVDEAQLADAAAVEEVVEVAEVPGAVRTSSSSLIAIPVSSLQKARSTFWSPET